MTDALIIYQQFDQLQRAAIALQESGYFKDAQTKAQAIVKVMAGAELGLPPFASMTGINIIQGKPALGANVIATLVKNDPRYNYRVVECTNTACTLAWLEEGKEVGKSSFTIEEAKAAGLTGKDNWQKYPSDMLFARAVTRGARRFAPGIFGGAPVYTPEELGADTDEQGQIIEGTPLRDVPPAAPEQPELPSNGREPAQGRDAPALEGAKMSLEMAEGVTDSDGNKYADLSTEDLAVRFNSLERVIKAGGTKDAPFTPEELEERKYKRDAIKTLMKSRQTKATREG